MQSTPVIVSTASPIVVEDRLAEKPFDRVEISPSRSRLRVAAQRLLCGPPPTTIIESGC